jgi:ABC-type nitrate/sulfonate/bicarbonate transport system permease component
VSAAAARRWETSALTVLSLAMVIAIWEAGARLNPEVIPTPLDSLQALVELADEGLFTSVLATIRRILVGFLIGALVAVPLGVAMGMWFPVRHLMSPVVEVLRPISAVAWIPLALLWFGVTESAAYFIVAYGTVFPLLLNTMSGIEGVSISYVHAAQTLGAGRWRIVKEVILPGALPSILTGARLGLGLGIAFVVAAELGIGFTLGSGVGYLLVQYSTIVYSPANVLALVVVIGTLGFVMNKLLVLVEGRLTPWQRTARF